MNQKSDEVIIRVKGLSKTFEFFKKEAGLMGSIKSFIKREKLYAEAVKDVNFEIKKGEFIGFIGPNGAGKTTTLKMLSGILNPSEGEVTVAGFNPWKRKTDFKKRFALVMGQKNQLWWDLPPIDSYLLFKQMYEIPEDRFKRNLEYLSEILNIKDFLNVQVRKLSLGQRMKCELTGALLHDPDILFLDEPTIGLDVMSQNNIREFLKKYNQEKKATIILTSHYMEDIKRLCKRMVMINKGTIIYDGSFNEFYDKYSQEKAIDITFSKDVSKKDLAKFGQVVKFKQMRAKLLVCSKDITKATGAILKDLPVENISIHDKALEEIISEIF